MRILIRSHHALRRPDISGGAQELMKNIATALSESGWTVDILCPSPSDPQYAGEDDIGYHEFEYGDPNSSLETFVNMFRGTRTYRSIVRREAYDIILDDVSHYPFYPAHLFRPDDTKNVLFLHLALFGAAREFNGQFRGSIVNLIDHTLPYLRQPEFVCAGEGTEGRIKKRAKNLPTHVLHPCIRPNEFEYNFAPDSNTILYLGRLGPRKNVQCLLKAWSIVEQNDPTGELSLVVAGKGGKEQELHRLANELELTNVEFKGYVSDAEKRRLFAEALVYVLPSKMEGYVTSGLEALASGTPVVGSDTFGINDYIDHAETGYLFPVDDHNELAATLLELHTDPTQMESVAEAGRELALVHSYPEFRNQADGLFREIGES